MTRSSADRVRVLFIAGAGRSGTTLLECMLGGVPGIMPTGEITHLWHRGLVQNQLCGCGRPFRECLFWKGVMQRLFSDAQPDPGHLVRLRDSVCGFPGLLGLFVPALRTSAFRARLDGYASWLIGLYRAIADVSGADLLVDSSKYPAEALLLSLMDDVDLRVVHLVRDSRAVAHAWQKQKVRPEIHWRTEHMPRYSPLTTAVAWTVFNASIERLDAGPIPYLRVRYEDLLRDPVQSLSEICRLVGVEGAPLDFIHGSVLQVGVQHTASGNPARFHGGSIRLRVDRDWRRESSLLKRWSVTVLTLPQLRRYGYSLS